jgi:hypothetical protein
MNAMKSLALIVVLCACRGGAPRPLSASDAEVSRVEISRGRDSFALIQSPPGVWRVAPPNDEADGRDVADLLAGLRALKAGTRLSDHAAASYGLSETDATAVRVRTKMNVDPVFSALFGRRGLGSFVHMAAAAGGPAFLGEGPHPGLLARGAQNWRDRRLLHEPCANVELDAGRGWRTASSATAAALCGLRAGALLPALPEFLAGLDRPVLRVRSSGGAFRVGSRMGAERWVLVEGRTALFRAADAPLSSAIAEAAR